VMRGMGCVMISLALASVCAAADTQKETGAMSNNALLPLALEPLPLGSIHPEGWLEQQLRIQANGLSGHLDEFWADIKDSGWIGGKAEGWERVPYWLDGVVPLAYGLNDEQLKQKAVRFIDYALRHQQEDGWLGPNQSTSASGTYKPRDPWPVFVMLKVFTQYEEATHDPRVIPAMQKFLRALDKQMSERPLFEWNKFRWQDLALCIYWLYDRTQESWLLDLAAKAHAQGYDWIQHLQELPYKERVPKWMFESHVVNNAMAVKTPGVWYRQSQREADRETALKGIQQLDRYHGQFTGIFTGDECFAGKMPSQGTELCAVVEYLFSLEMLLAALGEPAFADRLERIAYNALPAPFSPDMWAHQYVQQANQAVCKVSEERVYATNGPEANLFGLEPNYGCCTANLHQGWPKFAAHLWMKTPDNGLAAVAYAPCTVKTTVNDVNVTVSVKTDYPFNENILCTVTTDKVAVFPLRLHVPGWTKDASLQMNQETPQPLAAGSFHTVQRTWEGRTTLALRFPMQVRVERRFNNAAAVERGPLVYSLKIGEGWKYLRGEKPHADWEVHPTTPWNYALSISEGNPSESFTFEQSAVGLNPFSPEGAPVCLKAKARQVPEWKLERNAAAPPPQSPVKSEQPVEDITFIPYGAAKLRITEFPVLGGQ